MAAPFTAAFTAPHSPALLTHRGPPVVRPGVYLTVGYRPVYTIVYMAPRYPTRTNDLAAIQRESERTGRPYSIGRDPIRVRITP